MQSDLIIRADFEGARLGSASIDSNIVSVELLYDEPVSADWKRHDYRLHFTFGIENKSERKQKLRVRITGGERDKLPNSLPLIFASEEPLTGYRRLEVDGASDEFNTYDFDIIIAAGKTLYLANCLPRFLSRLMPMFDSMALNSGADREVFGYSIEGRELVAYKFMGEGINRPLVLVSSGIHPPEPDTLATEGLIEYLGKEVSKDLRAIFDFVIVPVMNPDGYAHGSQAGNAAGINFYWDFRFHDPVHCPEATALYDFAMALKPVLYFDFHAYTFQSQKHASPYCKPIRRYRDDKVRKVVSESYDRVKMKVSKGNGVYGFGTYAPSTFGEILTRKLNTIAYAKYHIHIQDGVDECRDHAVALVKTVCEVLTEHKLIHPQDILVTPNGSVPRESFREIMRKLDVYWSGYLFPSFYSYYCRHFRRFIKRV